MKHPFFAYLLLAFAGLALWCSSCSQKQRGFGDNDIKFDSIRIVAVKYLFNDSTKPGCNLNLQFVYPVDFKDKKVLRIIQDQFIKSFFGEDYVNVDLLQVAEKFKSDYLAEFKNVEKEYLIDKARNTEEETAPDNWYSRFLTRNVQIKFNKNDLLNYLVYDETYKSGKTSDRSYMCYLLDLKTGQFLKEKDIFSEDYQPELSRLLVAELMKQNNVVTPDELVELGYFGAVELLSNDNFMIDEKGITYTYNVYEIAAYPCGVVKMFIPYEKLKNILNPESPVARLAGM